MKKIKTIDEAIEFLEKVRRTYVEDLREVSFRIYDENFSFYVKSVKELIDYANEQKEDVENYI